MTRRCSQQSLRFTRTTVSSGCNYSITHCKLDLIGNANRSLCIAEACDWGDGVNIQPPPLLLVTCILRSFAECFEKSLLCDASSVLILPHKSSHTLSNLKCHNRGSPQIFRSVGSCPRATRGHFRRLAEAAPALCTSGCCQKGKSQSKCKDMFTLEKDYFKDLHSLNPETDFPSSWH